MTVYQWLSIFGVLGLPASILAVVWRRMKKYSSEIKALKTGVQALLRAQMISDWNHYSEKGFAPIYARENFENCWQQYHTMGKNGVMDDIHSRFIHLPTEPPTTKGDDEND